MTANSLSAQFSRIWIPNSVGTITNLSAYADSITAQIGNDAIDGTTFNASGYPVARSIRKGALVASLEVKWKWHKDLIQVLRQIVGSVNGFDVIAAHGGNAAPTYGDEVFEGTMTLLSLPVTLQPGQTVSFSTTFMPADGGSIVPNIRIW
jgi:hypothetical protein